MTRENAVKLGKAADASDMVDEYGARATSSMENKEQLHSLKDQPEEKTRQEIREKMKTFKFSSDPEVALKQFGADSLHPFQDTYCAYPEKFIATGSELFRTFQ